MSGFAIDPEDEAPSLVGLLDGLLDQGAHIAGDLSLGLADVELVRVALRLLVASEDTAQRTGRAGLDGGFATLPEETETRPVTSRSGPSPDPTAPAARRAAGPRTPARPAGDAAVEQDRDALVDGVARLVLTVVGLIHDLVERQAIRRVEAGSMTDDQVERLGVALQALEDRMADVRDVFGVTDEDLNLDLGPLGKLR